MPSLLFLLGTMIYPSLLRGDRESKMLLGSALQWSGFFARNPCNSGQRPPNMGMHEADDFYWNESVPEIAIITTSKRNGLEMVL